MIIADTNIVLRYVLNDHSVHSPKAKDIMLNNDILILTQVIAEVIYVLKGVYSSTKQEIADVLLSICSMENIQFESREIVICAINEFLTTNLDFVDALLYSHQRHNRGIVVTFDKKLNAKLKELEQG